MAAAAAPATTSTSITAATIDHPNAHTSGHSGGGRIAIHTRTGTSAHAAEHLGSCPCAGELRCSAAAPGELVLSATTAASAVPISIPTKLRKPVRQPRGLDLCRLLGDPQLRRPPWPQLPLRPLLLHRAAAALALGAAIRTTERATATAVPLAATTLAATEHAAAAATADA